MPVDKTGPEITATGHVDIVPATDAPASHQQGPKPDSNPSVLFRVDGIPMATLQEVAHETGDDGVLGADLGDQVLVPDGAGRIVADAAHTIWLGTPDNSNPMLKIWRGGLAAVDRWDATTAA